MAKLLETHFHEKNVLIELEWTPKQEISLFIICSQKGVLVIKNEGKNADLINFIKNKHFITRGSYKVQRIQNYIESQEFTCIEIDQNFLNPKRYQGSIDFVSRKILGIPMYQFRTKKVVGSNWSQYPLSVNQVLYTAYKSVSEYMLYPVLQQLPVTIGTNVITKKPIPCYTTPFLFVGEEKTNLTYIPNKTPDAQFIIPMLENIYDEKSYICGSMFGYVGYGTTKGIVITDSPFRFDHKTTEISTEVFNNNQNVISPKTPAKQNVTDESSESDKLLYLALQIVVNVVSQNRENDPNKPTGENILTISTKYETFKFELPIKFMIKYFKIKTTILTLKVSRSDILHNFAKDVLHQLQFFKDVGVVFDQTKESNLDAMLRFIDENNGDINNDFVELFNSFPKQDLSEVQSLLTNYMDDSNDELERILSLKSFDDMDKDDIEYILELLDEKRKDIHSLIKMLLSSLDKSERREDIIKTVFDLLTTMSPTEDQKTRAYLLCNSKKEDPFEGIKEFITLIDFGDKSQSILTNLINATEQFKTMQNQEDCIEQIVRIKNAINNIKSFQYTECTYNDKMLFADNITNVFDAIATFCKSMNTQKNPQIREIEQILFNLVFTPSVSGDPFTQVYPVYQEHDQFLNTESPFINFKSSTGSGKTRCAPFFFSIKALMDRMKRPFFIMTQPGASIITDKIADFKNLFGDKVIIVNTVSSMIKLYKSKQSKPVVALFSPHNVLRLLSTAEQNGIDVISRTRFCLDEIHERSVDTDVLVAILSKNMLNNKRFPLQMMMMSATPDERILRCFNNKVTMIEMRDTQLFPIKDVSVTVNNVKATSSEAAKQTLNIIKEMAKGVIEPGHILIFASSNSRMNEIMKEISSKFGGARKELRNEAESDIFVRDISLQEKISLESKQQFNHTLDDIIGSDNDTLFVVPIKFAGFVPPVQKEIAKDVIQNHENVVKIIIGTNAIESSITINDLVAVVDTGLFNQPIFNIKLGLTKLTEETISVKSSQQRRGRVGRVKPGVCVRILVKGKKFQQAIDPAIKTTDITLNILSLRKIGIRLEEIDNLPDKLDMRNIASFMKDLNKFRAIDKSLNITEMGEKLLKFDSLTPFFSYSIVRTCKNYKDKNKYLEVLGSLIVLIITSNNLITDPFASPLQDRFDPNSDVITVLRTLLWLRAQKNYLKISHQNGINPTEAKRIFSTIDSIATNIGIELKTVYSVLRSLSKEINLMDFINAIISNIERVKKDWAECRKAKFLTIEQCETDPKLIYSGSPELAFENEESSFITISRRPGSNGYSAPGSAFVFDISHVESNCTNYGSFVHVNSSDISVVEPKVLLTDYSIFTEIEFTSCLLHALLDNDKGIMKFSLRRSTGRDSGTEPFIISQYKDRASITFVPYSPESEKQFQKCVRLIRSIIPFTPSSIIVRHQTLNCAIEMRLIGSMNIDTNVIFFQEKKTIAYKLDEKALQYISTHIHLLKNQQNDLRIAITGESLSFPMSNVDENDITNNWIVKPHNNQRCECVFSDSKSFYSHLVLLSNKPIGGLKHLPWLLNDIYAEYTTDDFIANVANALSPFVAKVRRSGTALFVYPRGKQVQIKGKYPMSSDDMDFSNSGTISIMFDRFAMGCVKKDKLTRNVDLKHFQFESTAQTQMSDLYNEINHLKNRRKEISRVYNSSSRSQQQEFKREQINIKQRLDQLYAQIESLKSSTEERSFNLGNSFVFQHNDSSAFISVPDELNAEKEREILNKVMAKIPTLRSFPLRTEKIPFYTISVLHSKDSDLNAEEFENNIKEVTSKFGAVIKSVSKYKESKFGHYIGSIIITVYTSEFTIPLVGMISEAVIGSNRSFLKIPIEVIDTMLFRNKKILKIFEKWLYEHDLDIHKLGIRWIGSDEDIEKCTNLFKQSPPEFPFKSVQLPSNINMEHLNIEVRKKSRQGQMYALNIRDKVLSYPNSVTKESIDAFIAKFVGDTQKLDDDDEDKILADYMLCCDTDAVLSRREICIYEEDGTVQRKHFCKTCITSLFEHVLERMYDFEKNEPKYSAIFENVDLIEPIQLFSSENKGTWPTIPFGQMIYAFVQDEDLISMTRTYVTAIAYRMLRSSPLVTFCPAHPSILMKMPPPHTYKKCPYADCRFCLCPDCNKWHVQGNCQSQVEVPKGDRVCPHCKRIIEKTQACNHITCSCGKHFCYYCGAGPWDDKKLCYSHMSKEHSGCLNDPPDYRKYYKHESVPDQELEEFYKRYPQFRNLKA